MDSEDIEQGYRELDLESGVSFEKSEYMAPSEHNELHQPQNYEASEANSGGCSSVYSGEKTSIIFNKEDLLPPHNRQSSRFSASSFSDREQSIAEPVSITVIDSGNVKSIHQGTDIQDEQSELDDDEIKPIQKLSTMRSTDFRRSPNYSYSTNTDAPIPPRSSKRPKSELLDTNNDSHKDLETMFIGDSSKHSNHQSFSLNDDLDKLMVSARSISSKTEAERDEKTEQTEQLEELAEPKGSSFNDIRSITTNNSSVISEEPIEPPHSRVLPKNRITSTGSLPPRPSAESIKKARQDSNHFQTEQEEPKHKRSDSHGIVKLSNSEFSSTIRSPKDIRNSPKFEASQPLEDDDEYYDIGEELDITHKPSRAKSVKNSTQHHKRSNSKRAKSKRVKNSTRPFSYSTLISLLESTNGTIIGEEFRQLNLPVKEKQLIEKIVDSLSRLTSEMVLDEQRYDVGIQRLEKALRVLEGFL